jgi:SAM-dependent methyltransferase
VLTVDYDRLDLRPGMTVLDLGCGEGRHAFEAYRRGAAVVAVDWGADEVATTRRWLDAIAAAGEAPPGAHAEVVRGDLTALPVPDASVDRVIASEVLEHIPDDGTAIREIARVLKPGGRVAVTVPRYGPERICWALSDEYHANEGGHVRIYRADLLRTRLAAAGLVPGTGHHAHALHAPYWWLKCAVGVDKDSAAVRAYHRFLVWDLTKRPWLTRTAERLLDPLFGKSLVVYADKPVSASPAAPASEQEARRPGSAAGGPLEWERTAAAR